MPGSRGLASTTRWRSVVHCASDGVRRCARFPRVGEVTLHIAGQDPVVLGAGQAAFAPHGVPHVYIVTSETPARWLGTSTGHQFASFVEALSTPAANPTLPSDVEIDPGHVAAVAARHGIELLRPPGTLPEAPNLSATV